VGYAHDSTRAALRRRRIGHVIPERSDQKARRAATGARGGRPPDFDKQVSVSVSVSGEKITMPASSAAPRP
jgi:hypothetical protein